MESGYLETIAEIAASFVGFAALVLAVRERSALPSEGEWIYIARLIERGLAAVAFSLLPQLLTFLGYELDPLLPTLSALLATYFVISFVLPFVRYRELLGTREATMGQSRLGMAIRTFAAGVMIPVQALAAFQVLPFPALGLYVLGCAWLLVLAGITFSASLLTRPRAAQQSAAADPS